MLNGIQVASGPGTAIDAVIANGAQLSGIINMGSFRAAAVLTPAGFEGTSLTFQGSVDGNTFKDVYKDDGSLYTVTTGADRWSVLDLAVFASFKAIKIKSGSAVAADRTLTVACLA